MRQSNSARCRKIAISRSRRAALSLLLPATLLRAGWNAHKLNAPGKFLVSAPERDSPKNARSYEVKDQVVTETAAFYADTRPEPDEVSRQALATPGDSPSPGVLMTADGAKEIFQSRPDNGTLSLA